MKIQTSKADQLRAAIRALNGAKFAVVDLPPINGIHMVMKEFAARGEVEILSPPSCRQKVFRELTLRAPAAPPPAKPTSPWADVWPEFFNPPSMTGEVRVYGGME